MFTSRRSFLKQAGLAAASAGAWPGLLLGESEAKGWRAAIIGCTGQGDYGHNLDMAFGGVERVTVVALADPNDAGRARAAERVKPQRVYSDYREMLSKEHPDLVVVAPRWSERHFEFAMAALDSGAHVLTEKPFTVTLTEADSLLVAARKKGRRIAVAHQMRLAPSVTHLRRRLEDGLIGDIVQLRAWGKQDARAGGEDMLVLGTHLFDMMRLLAGDARSCTAQVWTKGRPVTRADARPATEKIGPVCGDEIEARYEFARGITASFTSRGRLRETLGPWALELLGSKGAVRILMDIDPVVLHCRRTLDRSAPSAREDWLPLPDDPSLKLSPGERGFGAANRRVVLDWLDAIAQDREPQCSGENAMRALEIVMATYWTALQNAPVNIPLAERAHPLQ
ncbi:MAG: Gfo/Idh/MocA family protein [Verrucomicrobiia bacterium]